MLRVTPATIRGWLRKGIPSPPSLRIGGRRRFLKSALTQWIRTRKGSAGGNPQNT
jgi:DNA-binding transcriptional MerR regulator